MTQLREGTLNAYHNAACMEEEAARLKLVAMEAGGPAMTPRMTLAGMAMQSLMGEYMPKDQDPSLIAEMALRQADALLAELAKGEA